MSEKPDSEPGVVLDIGALRGDITSQCHRVVAIDGRGGSGKSTLARALAQRWPRAVVVEMDDFHRPVPERVRHPAIHGENFDHDRLLKEVFEPLAAGRAGRYRQYDWDADRLTSWRVVPADALVLLEGVYSTSKPLRGCFDYAIWVSCDHDVRLERGVERDGEAMRAVWVNEWMPAEDRYVEAEEPDARADLVLDGSGTGSTDVTFRVLKGAH